MTKKTDRVPQARDQIKRNIRTNKEEILYN